MHSRGDTQDNTYVKVYINSGRITLDDLLTIVSLMKSFTLDFYGHFLISKSREIVM